MNPMGTNKIYLTVGQWRYHIEYQPTKKRIVVAASDGATPFFRYKVFTSMGELVHWVLTTVETVSWTL